jgi:hypothetical protein
MSFKMRGQTILYPVEKQINIPRQLSEIMGRDVDTTARNSEPNSRALKWEAHPPELFIGNIAFRKSQDLICQRARHDIEDLDPNPESGVCAGQPVRFRRQPDPRIRLRGFGASNNQRQWH